MVQIRVADQVRTDLIEVRKFCCDQSAVIDGTAINLLNSVIERFDPDIWITSTVTFVETKYRVIKVRDFVGSICTRCKVYKILHDVALCMDMVQSSITEDGQYTLSFPTNVKLRWYKSQIFTAL